MDKSLEKEPADKKSKNPKESPPPSPPLSQNNLELSPNDDDSITTSTESSDTFETWTLVMDKQKLKETNRIEIVKDTSEDEADEEENEREDNEIEEDEECIKDKEQQDSSNDVTADDLSDGVSIISESESNGRISPHPYLRDHLHDLNLKFTLSQQDRNDDLLPKLNFDTEMSYPTPVIASEHQQLRQRPGRRSQDKKDQALLKASQSVVEPHQMPPIIKRGLQGIFYIGVALAILGLIGKIRNPTWSDDGNPSTAELEQKIIDMGLQNNLMRAEIDLLNKQVKYLNDLNDPQQHNKKSGKYKGQNDESSDYRDKKSFKAWSGIGDTLRPVDITKDDLKRPYKCPDGSFKEFAGMCVEKRTNDPNIVEQFEQVVDDFKQQSETIQTFEQVAEELHGFTESPLEKIQNFLKGSGGNQGQEDQMKNNEASTKPQHDFIKNKPIYEAQFGGDSQALPPASSPHGGHNFEKCKDKTDRKCYEKENKREFDNRKLKYPKNEKPFKYDSRGQDNDFENHKDNFNKRRYDSKERKQRRSEDSNERHHRRFMDDDNSKERYQKQNDDSKERYHKRSKEFTSRERFQKQKPQDSGEWQEKYMKHRENVRKENEQKYNGENKNWFIKRGDSRENKRNTDDIRYR